MLVFIARRLVYAVVTLVAVSLLAFFIIELAPGSALTAEISRLRAQGNVVSTEQVEALEEKYGVNDPWVVKYGKWAGGLIRGDFGTSFAYREPVGSLIWGRLGLSIALSLGAIIVAWGIAIPLGVFSATHRYTLPDNVITVLQFIGVAIPEFLLALAVMVAAVQWGGLEVGGLFSNEYRNEPWSAAKFGDMLSHLWMPMLVIAVGSTAWLTRVMRANLFDVLGQQYVQTARAKGVPERLVIWKHAVRNALHPAGDDAGHDAVGVDLRRGDHLDRLRATHHRAGPDPDADRQGHLRGGHAARLPGRPVGDRQPDLGSVAGVDRSTDAVVRVGEGR